MSHSAILFLAACVTLGGCGRDMATASVGESFDCAPIGPSSTLDWQCFVDLNGHLEVLLADRPSVRDDVVSTPLGRRTIRRIRIEREGGLVEVGYLVRTQRPLVDEWRILEGALRGTAEHFNLVVDEAHQLVVDGRETVDARVSAMRGNIARRGLVRLIATPDRLYHVVVISASLDAATAEWRAIIATLRIPSPPRS